jgi:segregation and condensation protein B
MYGTSKIFLQRFGLRDLRDLPPLRDFKDLGQGESPDLFSEDTLAMFENNHSVETVETLKDPNLDEQPAIVQEGS